MLVMLERSKVKTREKKPSVTLPSGLCVVPTHAPRVPRTPAIRTSVQRKSGAAVPSSSRRAIYLALGRAPFPSATPPPPRPPPRLVPTPTHRLPPPHLPSFFRCGATPFASIPFVGR